MIFAQTIDKALYLRLIQTLSRWCVHIQHAMVTSAKHCSQSIVIVICNQTKNEKIEIPRSYDLPTAEAFLTRRCFTLKRASNRASASKVLLPELIATVRILSQEIVQIGEAAGMSIIRCVTRNDRNLSRDPRKLRKKSSGAALPEC